MRTIQQNITFKTWRTIKLGIGPKSGRDFFYALERVGYSTDDGSTKILFDPEFSISYKNECEVELVRIRVEEMGLDPSPEKTRIIDICNAARGCGFRPCAEVGPQLLLQATPEEYPGGAAWWNYTDLLIGMEPINYYGRPNVLYIGACTSLGYPILTCKSANEITTWRSYKWIFMR